MTTIRATVTTAVFAGLMLAASPALPVWGPAATGLFAAQAADTYDYTKPRGSIYSRRRSPNLWSGNQPYKSPLYQKPSRNYGTPNWRSNNGGINPYDKPRRNYGGWKSN